MKVGHFGAMWVPVYSVRRLFSVVVACTFVAMMFWKHHCTIISGSSRHALVDVKLPRELWLEFQGEIVTCYIRRLMNITVEVRSTDEIYPLREVECLVVRRRSTYVKIYPSISLSGVTLPCRSGGSTRRHGVAMGALSLSPQVKRPSSHDRASHNFAQPHLRASLHEIVRTEVT